MARALLGVLAFLVCGCAALDGQIVARLQDVTSGHIGCPPEEIAIPAKSLTGGTWTATCEGRTFYCSSYSTGGDTSTVSCAAALPQE